MQYFIYVLNHTYSDDSYRDSKVLGFCDTVQNVKKLKSEALKLPGFNRYPDSFIINKYIINKIHWEKGFEIAIGEIGKDYILESDVISDHALSVKELGLKSIFSVTHSYSIDRYLDDERFIGVFSSEEEAEEAIAILKKQNGFIIHPDDFDISEIEINYLLWNSGF